MDSYGLESMRSCVPKGLIFSTFTNEDLRKLSVVKITTPLAFNALGHPLAGGLYDPALGSIDSLASCATCGLKQIKCFGHCGHIELPLPVLNPLYHKSVISLLKMCCLECHHVLVPHSMKCLLIGQLTLLHHGYIAEAQDLQNECLHLLRELATSDDDATRVTMTNFINTHIAKVISMSMSGPTVREFKGEAELRNQYIKEALSHVPKGKNCTECKAPLKKIEVINNKILIPQQKVEVAEKFSRKSLKKAQTISEIKEKGFTFLTPSECRIVLKNIFSIEGEFIKAIYPVLSDIAKASDPIDALFMDVVLVTPVNTRPVNFVRNVALEHPQNNVYKAILNECLVLKTIILMINGEGNQDLSEERKSVVNTIRGNTLQEKLQYSWENLQLQVDSLLDIEALKQRRTDGLGLKQIIEKKEGIIRMNMMGKRVNFAARTVITPDPNINVDEIGIPEIFARKLTYPVPVTTLNVDSLRRLVLNGPLIHPGANLLQNEDGSIIKLDENDLLQREGVAKKLLTPGFKKGVKILHRHLINGDVLLLNRQPTLHKPSIMAHKARILRGEKTFRLHYANCKAYNADFDGDEMNAHYPQNEVARSEGYNLAAVCRQYLVPKDGTPLGGLIQDHVVSGSRLTTRGRFFERSEYMNLVFQGLSDVNGDIKTLPPAIIKPSRLWSGKQIVSTVIVNLVPAGRTPLNLSSRAKIGRKAWGEPYGSIMSEEDVIIREGELLCGVLDKMHYGSTPYSLVHCVYELYGGETACKLLSAFSKLFTAFLQSEGFTLSIKDILVVKSADKKRRKVIQTTRKIGDELVRSVLGDADESGNVRESLARALRKDPAFSAALDQKYKGALDSVTNDINGVCLPKGLVSPFPDNNLQLMVLSGAKGSTVNTMQISCLLGQILLEGKRPPLMLSGRALPSFLPFDTSPRAGGFVDGRFMTGIQPQEFFFHCMAGREGLIDTAVKTSRSGYLQRCLVKHLEGLTVGYDLTVRDSDGSVYQFLYGEDGMEVTKCQFLTKEQLPFLADNLQSIYDPTTVQQLKESSETDNVKSQKKAVKRWLHKHGGVLKAPKMSAFTVFSGDVAGSSSKKEIDQKTGRSHFCGKLLKKWKKLDPEEKKNYTKQARRPPDPVNSKFQPDRNFGSVCEKLDDIINNYLKTHKTSDETALRDSVYVKAMTSLSEPGEPVGLLAAQSVGEPSTQMTLNTFHFAGRGEINVTLGIPRLKEILMVASKNIKTPSMEVPFRTDVPKLDKRADKLRKRLTRVTMADVLETITVTEKIELSPVRRQVYILRLKFLPHEAYSDKFCVTPKKILKHVKNKFLKELLVAISTRGKKQRDLIETETEREGSGRAGDDDDDEGGAGDTEVGDGMRRRRKADVENEYQSSDEEPENEDDDATTARRRQRHNEEQQYSDLEDDVELLEEIEHVSKEAKEKKKSEEDEENDDGKQKELKDHSALEVQKTEIIDNYIIDTEKYEWCEVTLAYKVSNGRVDVAGKLKQIAALSIISQVSGIKKAFVNVKPNGEKVLTTEGQNLREMFFYEDLLDMNRLYVNDIHAVAQTYGIEAAAKVIVKEVRNVFQVYGISVDPRHLLLIADYMTYNGVYQPLSRKGMEGASSPLQQMSFESSSAFLKTSVLRSKRDDLLSPSARLMLGRPIGAGTSSFDLLHAIKAQ